MLSIEIKVNGSIIAVLHAVNRGVAEVGGPVNSAGQRMCRYEWSSVHFPPNLDGNPLAYTGYVEHYRADGAIDLAKQICECAVEAEYDEFNK